MAPSVIHFKHKGNFSRAQRFFERLKEFIHMGGLDKYGKLGVQALSQATPVDSGKTANSWYYKIIHEGNTAKIMWCNSNENNGILIAVLLQYGHATRNGGWVEGLDYINPAMRPVFNNIASSAWEEVKNL